MIQTNVLQPVGYLGQEETSMDAHVQLLVTVSLLSALLIMSASPLVHQIKHLDLILIHAIATPTLSVLLISVHHRTNVPPLAP